MNKYILYTSITIPALVLSSCTNPADQALAKAKRSGDPADCLTALVTILREAQRGKDQQQAIEQLFELQSIVRQFSAKDALRLLVLYNEENTRKEINELQDILRKEQMNLPKLIDIIRGR